jgi:hypothetical protein
LLVAFLVRFLDPDLDMPDAVELEPDVELLAELLPLDLGVPDLDSAEGADFFEPVDEDADLPPVDLAVDPDFLGVADLDDPEPSEPDFAGLDRDDGLDEAAREEPPLEALGPERL